MSFQTILIHSEYKKVPCNRKFGNKFFSIGTTLIANIMSKIIFMKYLPPVRSKFVPKSNMLRIYSNLAHLIFQTY